MRRAKRLGSMASVSLSEAEKVYIVHGVQVAEPRRQPSGPPGIAGGGAPSFPSGGGDQAACWVYLVIRQLCGRRLQPEAGNGSLLRIPRARVH